MKSAEEIRKLLEDAAVPAMPEKKDFRIGCIGSGFIMRDCHLVAYRK